jgi:hypothetical protein
LDTNTTRSNPNARHARKFLKIEKIKTSTKYEESSESTNTEKKPKKKKNSHPLGSHEVTPTHVSNTIGATPSPLKSTGEDITSPMKATMVGVKDCSQ